MSLRRPFFSLLAIAFLSVTLVTTCLAASVNLMWSAPGDDSLTGRATRFDLRYSHQLITAANFDQATAAVNLPSPGPPGTAESVNIAGLLVGQIYYFAIKTVDDAGNWSLMSRVVPQVPQEVAGVEDATRLAFSAPWPNPARSGAQFRLELPGSMPVRVEVFDIGGRRVRTLLDETRGAGVENLSFDLRDDHGSRLAQGLYLVRARLGDAEFMRRVVVAR